MGYLLVVTLIQAFSFSLIGEYLAGHVDSYFAVLVRVVLAGAATAAVLSLLLLMLGAGLGFSAVSPWARKPWAVSRK